MDDIAPLISNADNSIRPIPDIYDAAFGNNVFASPAMMPNDISNGIPKMSFHSASDMGEVQTGSVNYNLDAANGPPEIGPASQDYSQEFKSLPQYQDNLAAMNDISASRQFRTLEPSSYSDSQREVMEKARVASMRVRQNQNERLNTFDREFDKLKMDYEDIMRSNPTIEQQMRLRDQSQQMQRQLEDNRKFQEDYTQARGPSTLEDDLQREQEIERRLRATYEQSRILRKKIDDNLKSASQRGEIAPSVLHKAPLTTATPAAKQESTTSYQQQIAEKSQSKTKSNTNQHNEKDTTDTPKAVNGETQKGPKVPTEGPNHSTGTTSAGGSSPKPKESLEKKPVPAPDQKSPASANKSGSVAPGPAQPSSGGAIKAGTTHPAEKPAVVSPKPEAPIAGSRPVDKSGSTPPNKTVVEAKTSEQSKPSSSPASPGAATATKPDVKNIVSTVQAPSSASSTSPSATNPSATLPNKAVNSRSDTSTPLISPVLQKGKRSIRFIS